MHVYKFVRKWALSPENKSPKIAFFALILYDKNKEYEYCFSGTSRSLVVGAFK